MKEFYYVQRPTVLATEQVIIQLDNILEDAIGFHTHDIVANYRGMATEVRSSSGRIDGTLVYFPEVSYSDLCGKHVLDTALGSAPESYDLEDVLAEDDLEDPDDEAINGALNDIRRQRVQLLKSELEAAERDVRDLQDEVAAAEQDIKDLQDEIAVEEGT